MFFKDRSDAGRQLAKKLEKYREAPATLLLALPRGGVVVAYEVATELHLPLDIICPRKIGAPFSPELAIGAITETGEGIFSKELVAETGASQEYIQGEIEREKMIAAERLRVYRKNRPKRVLAGKQVILIDDGIATGATLRAAIKTASVEKAKKIIVAVPVAPPDTLRKIAKEVDEVQCLFTPAAFFAVGQFYENFDQTSDDEVISLLDRSFINTG